MRRLLQEEHPPSPDTRSRLATTLRELGVAEMGQGRYREAIAWLTRALGHIRESYDTDKSPLNCRNTVELLRCLSSIYEAAGDSEAAETLAIEAQELERSCAHCVDRDRGQKPVRAAQRCPRNGNPHRRRGLVMDRTAGERKSNSRKIRPEIVTGTGPIYGQLRAPVTGASHILGTGTVLRLETAEAAWSSQGSQKSGP